MRLFSFRNTLFVVCLITSTHAFATSEILEEADVKRWLKTFEAAVNAKNIETVSAMLTDNFSYQQFSTEKGNTIVKVKDDFLFGINNRESLIENNKAIDIVISGPTALIIQDRKVKSVNDTMTYETELKDYFYLEQINGDIVLWQLQTEEQSDKTKVTLN